MLRKALCSYLAVAVCFVGFATAHAGEFSKSRVLGFSGDAKHFLFEEYGFSDGHGAPYLTLYAVDVANDKWLGGTPIRLKGDEEEGQQLEMKAAAMGGDTSLAFQIASQDALKAKRQEAAALAAQTLGQIGPLIASDVAYTQNPQDLSRDGKTARFSTFEYQTYLTKRSAVKAWTLTLDEKVFPAGDNCFGQFEQSKGYRLTLLNENTGEKRILNDDTRVPASRGCVGGYGIEQVHIGANSRESIGLAVLLRYIGPGFEGPNGRLLAVTTHIRR